METWIYSRYSPRPKGRDQLKEQAAEEEDASTILLQIESATRYAQMKGLEVTGVIRDPEVSARKTRLFDRPGGSRLKALPKGSHILAASLDRLFRDAIDGLRSLDALDKQGVSLHLVDGGTTVDASTADGRFVFTILLGCAAREPMRTAERTAAAYAHRSKNGQRMSAIDKIPFGKCVSPNDADRLVDSPAELAVIDEVRKLRAEGCGLRGICREMEERGVRLRGVAWHPETVRRILKRVG